MAKQMIVLKLSMEDAHKRAKAMKCAAGLRGVVLTSNEGDKLTVVGEGVDSVGLTAMLRKKMGYAELILVSAVDDGKEKKSKEQKAQPAAPDYAKQTAQPLQLSYYCDPLPPPPPLYCYYDENQVSFPCSIL